MTTTSQQRPAVGGNDFAQLGARLVRFGQALQEPSTRVSELVALAQACGINFKLRVVSETEAAHDDEA
ncbi:hypothetical protein [Pseudomonas chlororaphis]|uniref:Uncharacterized protein n=1 Tax=Pseudomonas chlororaphis O6 TaxID=1037915 RepID=A0AB33WSR8_9PSED|nr:hypothetical protein [Pseudomonas chlororaphis]EIM16216.1 hypothetical protein PchlO6_1207 [Pseudomonas chlororaphis O6]